jgi:hypothetical protein
MKIETDGSDQKFITVGPIRLTYVPARNRPAANDWIGRDVVRIQAYIDPKGSGQLHKGAEYPLDAEGVLPLMEALYRLEREALK